MVAAHTFLTWCTYLHAKRRSELARDRAGSLPKASDVIFIHVGNQKLIVTGEPSLQPLSSQFEGARDGKASNATERKTFRQG